MWIKHSCAAGRLSESTKTPAKHSEVDINGFLLRYTVNQSLNYDFYVSPLDKFNPRWARDLRTAVGHLNHVETS